VFHPVGSEYIDSMGLKIVTQDDVTITAHHHRLFFGEASIVFPITELGDEYMVMAHDDFYNYSPSEFVVLATEDNTTIDITPSALTIGFRPAGVPFSIVLDAGDVYQVQSMGDLTGSAVKARDGKKIVLFSGARQANVHCLYADDHLYEQDLPVKFWGMRYAAVPYMGQGGDVFRTLAAHDQTEIYFNCVKVRTLSKGQYFDTLVNTSVIINASRPVAIAQFSRSNDCTLGNNGDPTMLMLSPVSHFSTKVMFNALAHAVSGSPYNVHYVNIVCRTSGAGQVFLDNAPVGSSFTPIPGSPGYSTARISLIQGSHTLESDSGFIAYSYGFGNYIGYAYQVGYEGSRGYGDDLAIQHDTGSCAGEAVAFTGISAGAISGWQWSFGDGSSSNLQNVSHSYSSGGTYSVILSAVDGNGCPRFAESEVVVKDCPAESEACVFIPSAFSPNNDGSNETFCVYGKCIEAMRIQIFDRWGEKVFESDDMNKCWDGGYRGELMNTAVFFYYLEAQLMSGQKIIKKGDVSLIR
jgi:gliding motility-associated-like protein